MSVHENRLEAFSDGVLAIIITIMVLEMKVPHGETLAAPVPMAPVYLSHVLSFIHVGIYWNNRHHMRQLAGAVGGDWKGKISPVIHIAGILVSYRAAWIAQLLYAIAALLWLVPDRRIERVLDEAPH
ncbi:hypothetical protein RLIN73S_05501 [Rhodanobacter lindaniclasticus]